jgi:hypothetical protein
MRIEQRIMFQMYLLFNAIDIEMKREVLIKKNPAATADSRLSAKIPMRNTKMISKVFSKRFLKLSVRFEGSQISTSEIKGFSSSSCFPFLNLSSSAFSSLSCSPSCCNLVYLSRISYLVKGTSGSY